MTELGLSKIIEFLKNFNVSLDNNIDSEKSEIPIVKEEKMNYSLYTTLNKLRRNANDFHKFSSMISYDIYCKYLNNLLNYKKYSFSLNTDEERDKIFYDKINQYYTKAKDTIHGERIPCEINQMKYSARELNILNKLENLCYIRNHLKGKNKLKLNKEECLSFYNYMYSTMNSILDIILLKTDNNGINLDNLVKNSSCGTSGINGIFTELVCEHVNATTEPLNKCTDGENCKMEVSDGSEDNCNCTYSDIFLSVFFTVLGTLLLSFALYRFSPFGSWINRRNETEKKFRKTLDEEDMHGYIENDSSSTQGTSQNVPYNMSYHTFRN
ncbi:PIR Superfamily Protein [Plasmodium ovale wallikeri]|uniref:PIR Superfamily Protein n=1 Tax=Plasmodium ovale wallikeri TaxID=864142 RepID=A0A1A9ATS9_PLAOA|nr:PIR Superfamily Protein [Plasmodium ovale wallikeri]